VKSSAIPVAPVIPKPIVGFRIRGETKTRDRIAPYLAHMEIGEVISAKNIPEIEQAFVSSELFEKVTITLEDTPGGYLVIATVVDKHSWIVAPTVFALPGRKSFGLGFAENNLFGLNQKLLLYAQYGDRDSLLFGTYLVPQARGTPLTLRADVYTFQRVAQEYANPPGDPTDATVARESTTTYLGGGFLIGWRFAWWCNFDLRMRGAKVSFADAFDPAAPDTALPLPEKAGWDVSTQARITLDGRHYRFGVSWGGYFQLIGDTTIPGLDDYDYQLVLARAYYAWRLFQEHQFEMRATGGLGRRLPFHEELTLGSVTDLRGYATDRFRGDTRGLFRVEYSVPITKWRFFAFRALGFWDTGYMALRNPREEADRVYLPNQREGSSYWRNDVGAGIRVYVKAIVLPLLGLDIGYGIEARSPEVYFQLGLTDF
jgi:outer membrane protein insertion porin family